MKHKFEISTEAAILLCKVLGTDALNSADTEMAELILRKIQDTVKKNLRKRPTDLTDKCGSCKWSKSKKGTYIDCICPEEQLNFFARTQKKCRHYVNKFQESDVHGY